MILVIITLVWLPCAVLLCLDLWMVEWRWKNVDETVKDESGREWNGGRTRVEKSGRVAECWDRVDVNEYFGCIEAIGSEFGLRVSGWKMIEGWNGGEKIFKSLE